MDALLNIEFGEREQARKDIYPVSVHCHSSCNLVVWRAESDPKKERGEIRKYVARLMDRLADLMHDYQKFSPLVALIDLQVKSDYWLQLMGDQDWHRGRFVLQAVRTFEGKCVEQAKSRWLGAPSISEYKPRRITTADFSTALTNAVEMAKPPRGIEPQLFTRYADLLKDSVAGGTSYGVAENWQEELVKDINNLIGKPVLEVSSLG
ncbi:hypothetical protein [Cellvibrio sp. PSBB006]|uniref:hypothetical protein n=1 Tax=Cellvibrio sp. PSBB006 TaxID=1987723 RepID=UPI000B3B30BE|nr:hypothetical protein [Cellvibrio sp. PSBB006]ARU26065.1 hypothetical protein CBR65_00685 [Cellvibrio sp. PSBB006]